ncbi:hypothetical protein HMPREF0653_00408 [Prevotella disiens JCM 6334 = ATCC 29426]|uniref:Uncharacterized protein n=1 Tax=Prevotella disiens JCM 6334 = ATCC 29426 TaxID=1235811 RepID=A0ABP2YF98_9BACT|nr:hypothetical protein HMPREF0653_00408 [Prevotella disiens JCM 6334 = ATCC 29426]
MGDIYITTLPIFYFINDFIIFLITYSAFLNNKLFFYKQHFNLFTRIR